MAIDPEGGHAASQSDVRELYRQDNDVVDEYRALAADLSDAIDGTVRFDEYAQVLYSSDGSIYQARPAGVVEPKHEGDVRKAVTIAHQHDVPIMARGAGSSLSGQAVGPGCLILDFSSYMDAILSVDPEAMQATVQPGVVQDHLDAHVAQWGLKFAPDPASSNRATVGGGIGNNSTGAHSVRYGITDAYTEELKVVLSDGSVIHTKEVVLDSPEWERIIEQDNRESAIYQRVRSLVETHDAEIEERYPTLKRRVTGYNLDRILYTNSDGEEVINLSKVFVGSESTLGIVVEATVGLVTKPDNTALALYCFEELSDALRAVPQALQHDVSAVELMDDEVFDLARASEGYAEYAAPIPEGTAATLMIEWDDELVENFSVAMDALTDELVINGAAFDHLEAHSNEEQARLWKLRKAAIPLLMSLEGDPKPYPFIEDATVPPEELAEYVASFEDILSDHGTSAAYFAHAGSGTLHIRPILNLKTEDGVEVMHSITDAVTDLVLEHHGSFSGEHGDGMARTEFTPKMYGTTLWNVFKELKTVFDPDWLLHPGNVVYREGPEDIGPDSMRGVGADMRENLRYGPSYQAIEPQTTLDFSSEGGFQHLVELCNGCGTCRQQSGDVMCPTYRVSSDEQLTTRGRANMLRAAISGEIDPASRFSPAFQRSVLDLCIGCKGCKSDCPTGVDMAKLKAETKHGYLQQEGADFRTKLFANIDRYASLGSRMAPVSNWLPRLPGARWAMESILGIAAERDLPTFQRSSLDAWDTSRDSTVDPATVERHVLLLVDPYTRYSSQDPAKAAVRVLESAGISVTLSSAITSTGRAAFSVGMLEVAKEQAESNATILLEAIRNGDDIVAVEPSDAVMLQDEYRDLLGDDRGDIIAANAYGLCEYLMTTGLIDKVPVEPCEAEISYHSHCHQHAMGTASYTTAAFEKLGFTITDIESGCCGMAGSFGYEAEHYQLSKAIGDRVISRLTASSGERVIAPGVSCRTQLSGLSDGRDSAVHPIELLDERLLPS